MCHILCRDGTVIHVPERIQLWTKMSEIQSEIKLITMSWITIHSHSIVGQLFYNFHTIELYRCRGVNFEQSLTVNVQRCPCHQPCLS